MMAKRRLIGMTIAACVLVGLASTSGLAAKSALDVDPDALPGGPSTGTRSDDPAASSAVGRDAPASANPLWAIPLRSLRATRERPIFLPSRRPPAPAAATAPGEEPTKSPPAAAESEKPPLSLVGVVSGATDGYAVFIELTTRDIVRLRTGEGHQGWILRTVREREAVLEKDHRSAVVGLPTPEGGSK
jgi:general secretion pathway protein N